jgi:asparagine synthetase B (glutamine-hydrolysing)
MHERLGFLERIVPRRAAGWLARWFEPLLERLGAPSLTGSLDATLSEQLRRYGRGEHLFWGFGVLFTPRLQQRLFTGRPAYSDPYEHVRRRIARLDGFHRRPYLDQLTLIDLTLGLPERLLMRVDKATMLYSVEARVPFLDPEVVDLALEVPPRARAAEPKGLLKLCAREKLPHEILHRRKVGFPTARRVFMAPKVLTQVGRRILEKDFLDFTGFDPRSLREFLKGAGNGRSSDFYHVWSLYVLSLWFHYWVEGRE